VEDQETGCGRALIKVLAVLIGLCVVVGIWGAVGKLDGLLPRALPTFPTAAPFTPWPTPAVAATFDFPLLPAGSYGPYVQGVTGPLAVDTRYGTQNPAQGDRANCFRDGDGGAVPFSRLYHAGVDLFARDGSGGIAWGEATHAPVHAVATGVVVFVLDAGQEGQVVGIEHRLADGSAVYSVYWHVSHVPVQAGQPVTLGQMIAVVHDMGLNSHLHWEMRTFRDGSDLFPAGTAGARGTCNRQVAGVGYTWDDDPTRAHPDYYGYLDPSLFVEGRR